MIGGPRLRAAAAAALLLVPAAVPASAEPGDIKGMDVKGDRSRSANDGWSQAPVPREESAAKDAPNPGGESMSNKTDRPVPKAGETNNGPDDPQKPLDNRTSGPSGHNPAAPTK